MSAGLFNEFDKVSAKQWKQKIQYDLKGEDYNTSLIWNSNDGVDVKPFYTREDASQSLNLPPLCGWNICESIYVISAEKANITAQNALKKGAESLWFVLPSEDTDLEMLFASIPSEIPVYLGCRFLSGSFNATFKTFLSGKDLKVYLLTDIIGKLARTGNWFHSMSQDHELLNGILQLEDLSAALSVNLSLYQNSGATIPQQLAYSLAHLNEYFNHINELADSSQARKLPVVLQVAIGSNYFFEIAKLRALRILYKSLAKEYGFEENCIILAEPSKRNKTIYDYNVNLLRTTTECMSAILGGADSISNIPYDVLYHKSNEFGSRIARNQLLILKHESYFEKVANPAEGSYYIENLSLQFAENALELFRQIEKNGGFLKQLKEGVIQKKISESAKKEQQEFDKGEIVLVGTNKYPNPKDQMKGDLDLYPFLKKNIRKTLLEPILEKRLAERMERERLNEENQPST